MQYIPLFLYTFRWNIEADYYEQKTFWSLCSYMVRICRGIEMMANLINIAYCAMKLLPYQDETFAKYHKKAYRNSDLLLVSRLGNRYFMPLSWIISKTL